MVLLISIFLWLICSFFLCLFSFFVGRCARKLPIIDDGLPWAMSRSQFPCVAEENPAATGIEQKGKQISPPGTSHGRRGTAIKSA